MAREPREKKESLKKREAKGVAVQGVSRSTPDVRGKGSASEEAPVVTHVAPIRYRLPPPRSTDYDAPRGPSFTFHHSRQKPDDREVQFFETSEHVYNKKGFRYTHCIADPTFASSWYYRQSETGPYCARINFEDTSSHLFFDQAGNHVTTEKGFRMARANVAVREGRWYWECKIVSGIGSQKQAAKADVIDGSSPSVPSGHVRMGWARREASLDTPVGFDAYSYGLRDASGQKTHMSRPADFFPPGEEIREGDVIGLEISLPSTALHRKIVEGQYNPAVDTEETVPEEAEGMDVIRDRLPIRYKAHLYFEQFEYHSTKELEELANPSPVISASGPASKSKPGPTHPQVPLRTLPGSYIRVYKNGRLMGTPFEHLFAFLPPASKPLAHTGGRDGLDDGMLGYFPAVSVFRGGAAEVNFGPQFWYPPAESVNGGVEMVGSVDVRPKMPLRAVGERYEEQIAEDVTYDLVDEVDFWCQDRASKEMMQEVDRSSQAAVGAVPAPALGAQPSQLGPPEQTGEIKEIVQEDE